MIGNFKYIINPSIAVAAIFGVLAGMGGILHGIGEILQGNITPDGFLIESWATGPIAEHMDGDPALIILPNMLITGILAIIVSGAVIIWSVGFVHRIYGGLILILMSVVMFLVGGGFGPPTLGILAGVAGLGIHSRHDWTRRYLPTGMCNLMAMSWPWIIAVCVLNGIFLIIGHIILVFLLSVTNADLFLFSFFIAVVTLLLSILTGIPFKIHYGIQHTT